MNRRTFITSMALGTFIPAVTAQTPARANTVRVGILALRSPHLANPATDALREGFRERGYIEGRNLVIEYPDAQGREDLLPSLAAELVRNKMDVILIIGPAPLQAARRATKTIPLVMVASSSDPVADGVALTLSRPGGNITGLTYAVSSDRFGKQLELIKSATGRVARVAVLWDFDLAIYHRTWAAPLSEAGRILGVNIEQPVRVKDAPELPPAFALFKERKVDAIVVASGGAVLFAARGLVGDLALQHRLPAISAFKEFPQAGLLMSYGPDLPDINRKATGYVDRILKGAKPGDLPIELPTKYEMVVNMKTAKALGLAIPQSVLLRADEVIQ